MKRLRIPEPPARPMDGHLAMGEEPGAADAITVNAQHLIRAGIPWFPVMGEFHFSRYPHTEWREELLKIRAGGITVVATYVLWNVHEEHRGVYNWSGDRDLRRFIGLCAEVGLDVMVRLGPWAHGESRYGGFPDWLVAVDCEPRTDDPRYLALVRPYLDQIGSQLKGLTRDAGGPIVAVQVENELYDQPGHLLTIKTMAQQAGISAPLWTATGWGHAQLPADEVIPLFGGYSEAAWDTAHDGWPAQSRAHYFFGPGRDDDSIGADLRAAKAAGEHRQVQSWPSAANDGEQHLLRYPFATCELGGGMYTSYHRRAIVEASDIAALALVKIGSGAVWQGYYLYHGASQKVGELSPLQESHATGYPNDCPVINYDFQAPLGEYGQFRESFAHLRLQHLWLASDGADLATMTLAMPDDTPADVADRSTLRWAVRSDGVSGFLFVNNHQPVETLPEHRDVQFSVTLGTRELVVPSTPVTIPSSAYFAWPLVRRVGSALLLSATAQIVCRLDRTEPVLVLAQTSGVPVEILLDTSVTEVAGPGTVTRTDAGLLLTGLTPGTGCRLRLTTADGAAAQILVLDQASALTASRLDVGGSEHLLLSQAPAVVDGEQLVLYGTSEQSRIRVYPAVRIPEAIGGSDDGVFAAFDLAMPRAAYAKADVTQTAKAGPVRAAVIDTASGRASAPTDEDFDEAAVYRIAIPADALHDDEELVLRLDWIGDVARAYIGGDLVADQFWHGPVWEIGLRRFRDAVLEHGMELRILPLAPDAPVFLSPHVRQRAFGAAAELLSASLAPVLRTRVLVGVA